MCRPFIWVIFNLHEVFLRNRLEFVQSFWWQSIFFADLILCLGLSSKPGLTNWVRPRYLGLEKIFQQQFPSVWIFITFLKIFFFLPSGFNKFPYRQPVSFRLVTTLVSEPPSKRFSTIILRVPLHLKLKNNLFFRDDHRYS